MADNQVTNDGSEVSRGRPGARQGHRDIVGGVERRLGGLFAVLACLLDGSEVLDVGGISEAEGVDVVHNVLDLLEGKDEALATIFRDSFASAHTGRPSPAGNSWMSSPMYTVIPSSPSLCNGWSGCVKPVMLVMARTALPLSVSSLALHSRCCAAS